MPEVEQKTLPTPLARLSYPATHTPRPNRLDPTKPAQFGGTLIFNIPEIMANEKEKAKLAALINAAQVKMKGSFATATWEGPFMDNTNGVKGPWIDGNSPKYRDKDGMGQGVRFIRTSSNRAIPCVARDGATPITDPSKLYPGCYVYAYVAVFSYDPRQASPGANYGVGFGLRAVQFAKDGPRLDDSFDVQGAFNALDGDDEGVDGDSNMSRLEAMFGAR